MSDSTTHEEWDDLAAGHSLHALDPADESRFLAHLGGCERCAQTLDECNLVAAQLGALTDGESDEPPSWNRIRGAILDEPAAPLSIARQRRPVATRLLAAAAAVVTVTAVGVVGWQVTQGGGSSPTPHLAAVLSACQQQVGCRAIRLHTSDGANPAAVVVNGDRVAVVPLSMKAAPNGRTYVLWQLLRDGGPIPISEFRETVKQTAAAPLPSDYADTAAFAISIESANKPPTKPTKVLAVGTAT